MKCLTDPQGMRYPLMKGVLSPTCSAGVTGGLRQEGTVKTEYPSCPQSLSPALPAPTLWFS